MRFFSKFFFFALFIGALSFTGCGEDEETIDPDAIIGTWSMIDFTATGTITTTDGNGTSVSDVEAEGSEYDYRVTFSDDKTYTSEGQYTLTTRTTTDGQTETEVDEMAATLDSGTWEIDGDIITFTDTSGEAESSKILRLRGSNFEIESSGIVEFEFFGIQISTDLTNNVVFEK
ncbi:MAG: DUF5004 domain-containing protein [Bacteroidota bacterium]